MDTLWSERGYFGLLENYHILVYYHAISYQRIKFYKVETINMEILRWKNGGSGKLLCYLLYGIIYFGSIHTVFNGDTLPTHSLPIKPYIELRTVFSYIFVLCLMESYHIY